MGNLNCFQGQQNDYILLSLVRTRAVGHLRDVRRLVVAMSRARLGLYVFARASLFANCFELTPAFKLLLERPNELLLLPKQSYPTDRLCDTPVPNDPLVIKDMPQMANFVFDFYKEKVETISKDPNAEKPWARPVENMEDLENAPPAEDSESEESAAEAQVVDIVNEIEEEEKVKGKQEESQPMEENEPTQESEPMEETE